MQLHSRAVFDAPVWLQARASWARVTGMSEEDIERYIWTPHHTWAGDELYGICIGLRGFYMKVTAHLLLQDPRSSAALTRVGALISVTLLAAQGTM